MHCEFFILVLVCFVTISAIEQNETNYTNKCEIPPSAPKKVEEVINQCQDEIKLAILSEVLQTLNLNENEHSRSKRAAFSDDEKRIAGCLLQCVYRKMNAVNETGFPTAEGLISLYTQGIEQKDYIRATIGSVHLCLKNAEKKYLLPPQTNEANGWTDFDEVFSQSEKNYTSLCSPHSALNPDNGTDYGKICDIAFDVFNCVSEEIGKYCGQTP